MKKALFLLLATAMMGCYELHKRDVEKIQQTKMEVPDYTVIEIDSCEYLKLEVTHSYATLTHKGNCKNPIHCRNVSPQNSPTSP